eukprot:CAMPEP_0119144126 /NCGR_PEP_ID=MMETSP1310-20130426/35401_1 /TAXON_ID=464262 /ORGANISM="Genus nov. species nov., Strain RCC2339" /LENGTH=318 /DNA_ID=CAMNT_0007135829 /DNA_START=149 /DNA_END=1105 /DNA_ORIENTATION=-
MLQSQSGDLLRGSGTGGPTCGNADLFRSRLLSELLTQGLPHSERGLRHGKDTLIVMSGSRTGSSFVCAVLAKLFEGFLNYELFRMDPDKQIIRGRALAVLQQELGTIHDLASRCPKRAVTGGKWKPRILSSEMERALRWVGQQGIPVVFNDRNALDVLISQNKRRTFKELHHKEKKMSNHCRRGTSPNELRSCLAEHKTRGTLNTTDLVEQLEVVQKQQERWLDTLKASNVTHFHMHYEDWAYGTEESRLAHLQEVANFVSRSLGRGDFRQVTVEDFDVMFLPTTPTRQDDTLTNFDQVAQTLRSTPFRRLLKDYTNM